MPVHAHELVDGGVVLVCSTSGLPLPLSVHRFESEEQAEWFLASLHCDARLLIPEELQGLAEQWQPLPPDGDEPGSVCGDYPAVPK